MQGGTGSTAPPDVDRIADAIAGSPSRRSVVRGAAWSVSGISAAIAAPAAAASTLPQCGTCVGQTGPPRCFISGTGGGTCTCASGLVCVGTGPLGLANVCVGSTLIGVSCSGTTCFGVCLSAGGTVPAAINTLTTAITSLINVLGAIGGTVTGTTPCTSSTPVPANWCVSPLTDGGLGTLCSALRSCHTGSGVAGGVANLVIGAALDSITTAYNGLISALGALGLVASPTCAAPYVCTPFVEAAAGQTFTFVTGSARYGLNLYVGFCQCPSGRDFCYDNTITYPCTLT